MTEDSGTFLPDGNYNKTEWKTGNTITSVKLNKIEDALYNINSNMEANDLSIINRIEDVKNTMYESDWYNPDVIKSTLLGEDGIPSEFSESTYEGFFEWILNPLVETYPDYISKTILGKDQSGIYNIYRYDFTPIHYDKTILLYACLHGNEYTSFFGLCRFLQELCDNKNTNDPNLQYIKSHIKLVVCPILNPWGFVNSKRQNVNGVDLNRNFDYRWNEYTTSNSEAGNVYYKGSEPFSEAESVNVRDMVYNLNAYNLVAAIDFHTIITVEAEKILYYPRFNDNIISALSNVVERFKYGENRAIFSSSALPTLTNYLSWTHKICCINPEWNNICHGINGKRDTSNMTRWVEWAGNLILSMAKNAPNRDVFKAGPFVKHLIFRADESLTSQDENRMGPNGYNVVNSEANELNTMNPSKYDFTINQQYVLHVTGWVKIKAVKETTLYLQPLFYQKYSPEQNYNSLKKSDINVTVLNLEADKEYFVPIDQVIQGFHSNYNTESTARADVVHFRLRAYCNVSSACYINAYNVTIHGTPSDVGEAVTITGITASGHERIFPLRIPEDLED